jgi:hypothetical protein
MTLVAFQVTLQPLPGIGGGPVHTIVEARDVNSAKRLAEAKYKGAYRISDVQRRR